MLQVNYEVLGVQKKPLVTIKINFNVVLKPFLSLFKKKTNYSFTYYYYICKFKVHGWATSLGAAQSEVRGGYNPSNTSVGSPD